MNIFSVLFLISETELSNNGKKSLISLVVLRETWNKFSYTNSKGNKQTNTNFLDSCWQYKQESSWWWKGIIQSLHPDLDSMNVVVVVVYARVVQIFCLSKWMNEIPFRFSFINIVVVVVNISIYQVKGRRRRGKILFPNRWKHTYIHTNKWNEFLKINPHLYLVSNEFCFAGKFVLVCYYNDDSNEKKITLDHNTNMWETNISSYWFWSCFSSLFIDKWNITMCRITHT